MSGATDGTCFHLPTSMHYHAFLVAKDGLLPEREFKVLVQETEVPQ